MTRIRAEDAVWQFLLSTLHAFAMYAVPFLLLMACLFEVLICVRRWIRRGSVWLPVPGGGASKKAPAHDSNSRARDVKELHLTIFPDGSRVWTEPHEAGPTASKGQPGGRRAAMRVLLMYTPLALFLLIYHAVADLGGAEAGADPSSASAVGGTAVRNLSACATGIAGPWSASAAKYVPSPLDCDLRDESACGAGRGQCVPHRAAHAALGYDGRTSHSCFWLEYSAWYVEEVGREESVGICKCMGRYDGVGCSLCLPGWAGAQCDVRAPLRVRRNLTALSEAELAEFRSPAFISHVFDTVSALCTSTETRGYTPPQCFYNSASGWFWMNAFPASLPTRGFTGEPGSSCPQATRDPHGKTNGPTVWGRPWHRAFQVAMERDWYDTAALPAGSGMPYWDALAPDAELAAARLHPALLAPAGQCTLVPLAWVSALLARTHGLTPPATAAEVVSSPSLAAFERKVGALHTLVHCWWVANGYGGDGPPCHAPLDPSGLNFTREEMLRAFAAEQPALLPPSRLEQCVAFFENAPVWRGAGNRLVLLPLFQMFHTYLDALFEQYMRLHGHAATCEALEALRFPATAELPAEEAHLDACIERVSVMMQFNLTYRMMCRPQRELFGVAYDFERVLQ